MSAHSVQGVLLHTEIGFSFMGGLCGANGEEQQHI